jgi:hypothetical protein
MCRARIQNILVASIQLRFTITYIQNKQNMHSDVKTNNQQLISVISSYMAICIYIINTVMPSSI